jgi:uncharacterized membrane protein
MTRLDRPRLQLPWTATDRLLAALASLGALLLLGGVPFLWSRLPDRVPTHFGFTGQPDAWGDKGVLLLLPFLGLMLYATLMALTRIPHFYNYPVRITPENAEAQYRLARRLLLALNVVVLWLFLAIFAGAALVALGKQSALFPGLLTAGVGVPLLVTLWYLVASLRKRAVGG